MKIFRRNTNESERKTMNLLTVFGHVNQETDLITWLTRTYDSKSIHKIRYKRIAGRYLKNGRLKVLEIGAGVGDFSLMCQKLYPQNDYYISDPADKYLRNNIIEAAKFFRTMMPRRLFYFPAEKIQFSKNSFDVVIMRSAVHHFEKPQTAFEEIWRVLKPGGRAVFFNDPLCLDIPVYKEWCQLVFSPEERKKGIKENIYPISKYLSFGSRFSKRDYFYDSVYLADFKKNFRKWKGLKKIIGELMIKNHKLFDSLLIKGYGIPFIFVFTK